MFCPNCGTKNDKNAVFCENCGARLNEVDAAASAPNVAPTATQPPLPPTPNVTTRVAQTAQKPEKGPHNKLIIGIIIAVVVLAAAGGGYYFYQQNQTSSDATEATTPKADGQVASSSQASSSVASQSSSEASSESTATEPARWSASKTVDLSSFMSDWQDTMNQSYVGTYDTQSVDDDGVNFPDDIRSGDYKGNVTVDDSDVTLKWTTKANTDAAYQVVAAAVYNHDEDGEAKVIAYLYVFHNGSPDVLVSQDSDSTVHNFTSSRNQTLQNGFAKIANATTD
ncbi:zinc ribbon domain-containing protein [Loigolactobacillus jiayinensis]|mgnify:CR=1 FL=1|uniref:DUF4767 domain-containing protein n=1 Tax=Loigolactobacillus jiayinensis TaxID=2486016 RepID=A0ABW1RC53_9LACO|nr:zinc ribbon domain-containing protein [Loigolactobacillus jiayinensis]